MFSYIKQRLTHHGTASWTHRRRISSAEIAAALRPFYFVVHPDLFGRHPKQRSINEESLKHLSAHLEAMQQQRPHPASPHTLSFYVRQTANNHQENVPPTADVEPAIAEPDNAEEVAQPANMKLIRITIDRRQRNTQTIIRSLLQSCNLSTEFVDSIKSLPAGRSKVNVSAAAAAYWGASGRRGGPQRAGSGVDDDDTFEETDEQDIYAKIRKVKHEKTLKLWLDANLETANTRATAMDGIREDVAKLEQSIVDRLQLQAIHYDCGWQVEHYRGCLKSLNRMADLHADELQPLRGRTVMFAPCSGVNLEGHVMLFTGDVHRSWLDFIRNIAVQDDYLARIPAYESALSHVLLDITIARRKFMPKAQVTSYADQLRRVTTSMLDYLASCNQFPAGWPRSLADFELVVECEAGPLMVSPTGQFITPSTCSGSFLVDFIDAHLEEARGNIEAYNTNKHIERDLHDRCIGELQLQALTKDDSIDPRRMIECLQRLLVAGRTMRLARAHLHITNYYSVLADGTVCIPWDWVE